MKIYPYIVLLVGVVGCASVKLDFPIPPTPYEWKQAGGSPERLHFQNRVIVPPFRLDWEYNAGGGFAANAIVSKGNVLFVSTLHGEVHLINAETGARIGRINFGEPISGSPVLHDDLIIVPLSDGNYTLVAYDLRKGERSWQKKLGPVETSPLLHGETLFVLTRQGKLLALDPETGEERWTHSTNEMTASSPAAKDEHVYVATRAGALYAVNSKTGTLMWEQRNLRTVMTTPVVVGQHVYLASRDSILYCIDRKSGEIEWEKNVGAKIYASPSAGMNYLVLGTAAGDLIALRYADGKMGWRFRANSVINSSPFIAGDFVYFVSLDKHIYGLTEESGELQWEKRVGSRLKTTPFVWNDLLIICAEDRRVYAFAHTDQRY